MSTPNVTAHNLNHAIAGRDHAAAEEARTSAIWRKAQAALAAAKLEEDETRLAYLLARNAHNRAAERLDDARRAHDQATNGGGTA